MQIETYEIEEIKGDAGTMAADAEAVELAAQLGLEGQQKLSDPETLTRAPYPALTALQRLVFQTLFPRHTPVEKYSEGIIPLRVLQVVAYCRQNHLYRYIHVWHPEPGNVDPVLIGTNRENEYSSGDDFLLARWGESLEAFEKLIAKAKVKWLASRRLEITRAIKEAKSDLELLHERADEAFETGRGGHCYYQGIR
jgi:hypothetical protein